MSIALPIRVENGPNKSKCLVAQDCELILSSGDATEAELAELASLVNRQYAASTFFKELLDSVECLTELVDQHGARTATDLMYLQSAILDGSFIDYYPGESNVLEIAKSLPSGSDWVKYIKVVEEAA